MDLITPGYEIIPSIDPERIFKVIEIAGRHCYKSEHRIREGSAREFVRRRVQDGHLSVLEHEKLTVKFVVDRGVSHQLVRHRLASPSQESTRFCNYAKDRFNKEVKVIDASKHFKNKGSFEIWCDALEHAERAYMKLIRNGESPEIARGVLPHALKTEVVLTANLREWRTIFQQRVKSAHPQMVEVMKPLFNHMRAKLPEIFNDLDL